MRRFSLVAAAILTLAVSGCSNHADVSPSQNSSLQSIAPSSTIASKGGIMQRSLDKWLAEEWTPMMADEPTVSTKAQKDGTVVTTKTEPTTMRVSTQTGDGKTIEKTTKATQITTTTKTADGTVTTTTEVVPLDEDNTPFTLQKYVDKWNAYLAKKEKMNEGKPKEPAHWEMLQTLPGIGK